MRLSDLVNHSVGQLHGEDCVFDAVNTDTRSIVAGQLFVALRGDNFDGHSFVNEAVAKGAVAIVSEFDIQVDVPYLKVADTTKAYGKIASLHRQSFDGKVVGVTGSCGKTTVKGLLKSVCEQEASCIATEFNFNNHIGVPLTLLRLNSSFEIAIVEAGTSGKGEIGYLTQLIDPDIAIITNVRPAHLLGFGTVEAIAEEKTDLYKESRQDALVVVNLDDPSVELMIKKAQPRKIIGYSLLLSEVRKENLKACSSVVNANEINCDSLGRASFICQAGDIVFPVQLSVVGEHNVGNALAAIASSIQLGISSEAIQKGLSSYTGDKGRMQINKGIHNSLVVDDTYNANPASMKAALDFLARQGKSIFICGDMGELGDVTEELHREVGRYAKSCGISAVCSIGRFSKFVTDEFGEQGQHFASHDALVDYLENSIDEGDVLVVKGSRYMHMENIVKRIVAAEVAN